MHGYFYSSGDHRVTVAEIEVVYDGKNIEYAKTFKGSAIRSYEDKYNPDVAELMAYARAFQNAGKRLERVAWGLVEHQDNNRRHKEKIATNAKSKKKKSAK